MAPDVSICVATCERPVGLARLLASLEQLDVPEGVSFEVIVVDNDPAGSASPVLARDHALPSLRSFHEPERNIALARDRGVREACGRFIAFLDDDEVADPGWLAAHWRQFALAPCDGLFGPVVPRLERVVTPWLDAQRFFGGARMTSGTPVGPSQVAAGNAFLRAELFEGTHFDPAFGLSGGEDSDLFGRMLRAGAVFRWCDEARATEWIPPARHGLRWLTRRAFRCGVVHTQLALRSGDPDGGAGSVLARAGAGLLLFGIASPFALVAGRAAAARMWLRGCTQAGHLWALLGGRFQEYGPA